jgi:hypothetical protein
MAAFAPQIIDPKRDRSSDGEGAERNRGLPKHIDDRRETFPQERSRGPFPKRRSRQGGRDRRAGSLPQQDLLFELLVSEHRNDARGKG